MKVSYSLLSRISGLSEDDRATLSCRLHLISVHCTPQTNIQTLLFGASDDVLSPRCGKHASKRVSRRCLRVAITSPQKQLTTTTRFAPRHKTHRTRPISIASIRSASRPLSCFTHSGTKLIFDGQAMSLDLSIGNFDLLGIGTILEALGEFGWVTSHEVLLAGAARQMQSFRQDNTSLLTSPFYLPGQRRTWRSTAGNSYPGRPRPELDPVMGQFKGNTFFVDSLAKATKQAKLRCEG